MRPIKLSFSGLNSYAKEQHIDFEKLTSRGLFGIFGPTGSGKSTILDAITIALYGDIARKSKEFLNTNCEELYVAYRFRLKSAEGVIDYTAERSFKRNKNGGKPNAKYVRLIKHVNGDELLAEKTTDMSNQVIDLLGLTMDDFTRSVVLPQGKFSDFLKLTGKDRRNMLERIFALEKYGRQMSEKIKRSYYANKNQQEYLKGQLKRYEEYHTEGLEALKEQEVHLEKEQENLDIQLSETIKLFEEQQEIWKLQEELHKDEARLKGFLEVKEEMNRLREQLDLAEKAMMIQPYINEIHNNNEAQRTSEQQINIIKENYDQLYQQKVAFEEKLHKVEKFETEDLPLWQEQLGRLKEAVKYTEECQLLKNSILKSEESIQNLESNFNSLKTSLTQSEKEKLGINVQYNRLIDEETNNSIPIDYKNKIDEAADIERRCLEKKDENVNLTKEVNNLKKQKIQIEEKLIQVREKDNYYKDKIQNYEMRVKDLESKKPGGLEVLSTMQEAIMTLQQDKNTIEKNMKNQQELNGRLIEGKDRKEKLLNNIRQYEEEEKLIIARKDELQEILDEIQGKYVAAMIAERMEEGQPCPVCGSTHHVELATVVDDGEIDQLIQEQKVIEKNLTDFKNFKQPLQVELLSIEKEQNRLLSEQEELLNLLKDRSLEAIQNEYENKIQEFNNLKKENEQWDAEFQQLLQKLKEITELYNNNRQSLMRYEENSKNILEQFQQKDETLTEQSKQLNALETQLEELKKELVVESFTVEKKRIQQVEIQIQQLREQKKKIEDESNNLTKKCEEIRNKLSQCEVNLTASKKELELMNKEYTQLTTKIQDICGDQEANQAQRDQEEKIIKYQDGAKIVRERLAKYKEQVKELEIQIAKEEQRFVELQKQGENLQKQQIKLMDQHGFHNVEQVQASYLDVGLLETKKKDIKNYEEDLVQAAGVVNNLKLKLADRSIEREAYEVTLQNKNDLQQKKEECLKAVTAVKTQIKDYEKAIQEIGDLLKEKEAADHQLSMLEDLSKLIKGNRFIEYVAKNQFHYIVHEASKRLYDLTGRYGIELDENSEFLIRDDRNGGALREAATLSGGETFLTSLALALALSSQIQLKGSYPLEFFFLDEGFGTLDSELLDVVMNSLEKLNNSQVNVGIISHVEELKNRVPIKLVIQPSELGGDGSMMKLEYS
ncbi:AAA family ATPase [Vallitalea okinawensis]|uniref:AAA family ATPase n=1 Tax=Vallitalea okinawensis TaxID=2078660 RepID=UPI000CFAFD25|nr:SMC family ATPase [Vallitalea okinawensis]